MSTPAQELKFRVAGEPKALERGKPALRRAGARMFAGVYDPTSNRTNRAYVRVAAEQALKSAGWTSPVRGPVVVTIIFELPQPLGKRVDKVRAVRNMEALSGKLCPIVKPDLDNLVKLVFDACNEVVWHDDNQVVELRTRKRYTHDMPGTRVTVRLLSPEEVLKREAHLVGGCIDGDALEQVELFDAMMEGPIA